MPMYEFTCKACKKDFERLCKYEEKGQMTCKFCDKVDDVEALVTAPREVYGNTNNGGVGNVLSPDSTLLGSERGIREEHFKRVGS